MHLMLENMKMMMEYYLSDIWDVYGMFVFSYIDQIGFKISLSTRVKKTRSGFVVICGLIKSIVVYGYMCFLCFAFGGCDMILICFMYLFVSIT